MKNNTNKSKSKGKKKSDIGVSNKVYEILYQLPKFFEEDTWESKDQEIEPVDQDPQNNEEVTIENEDFSKARQFSEEEQIKVDIKKIKM